MGTVGEKASGIYKVRIMNFFENSHRLWMEEQVCNFEVKGFLALLCGARRDETETRGP